jgi:parvulin-like peptidyl-prolyl isomerase
MRAYLNEKFMPAVTVNRRLLLAEYRSTLSKYSSPKMVQTQIIQIRPRSFLPKDIDSPTQAQQAAARAEAKTFAQKLLAKLKKGKTDFGEEARELAKKGMGGVLAGEGGIWPEPRQPESIRPEQVGQAVDELEEGQIAGLIETQRGFYIVRAYKVVPAKVTPFEQAQKAIEERMRNEQYNRMVSEYMQGLYKGLLGMDSEHFIRQALARAQELYYQQ